MTLPPISLKSSCLWAYSCLVLTSIFDDLIRGRQLYVFVLTPGIRMHLHMHEWPLGMEYHFPPLYAKKENHFCLQKKKCIVILNQQEVSRAIHTHTYTQTTLIRSASPCPARSLSVNHETNIYHGTSNALSLGDYCCWSVSSATGGDSGWKSACTYTVTGLTASITWLTLPNHY